MSTNTTCPPLFNTVVITSSTASSMGPVIDPGLVERFGEIAFNAGRLDRSIVLDPADYVRIVRSLLHVASTWSAAPDRAFGDGPCKHGIGPDRRPRRLEKYVLSRCPIPQQSA